MSSIREQIVSAAVALLDAEGRPDGLVVHRERTRPLQAEQLPAIVIYLGEEEPISIGSERRAVFVERQLALFVECRSVGSANLSPDEALDPLVVWSTSQLMKNEALGGLANGIAEGKTVWQSQEGDQPIAAAVIVFLIRYRTSRSDPTSQNSGGLSS